MRCFFAFTTQEGERAREHRWMDGYQIPILLKKQLDCVSRLERADGKINQSQRLALEKLKA